MLNLFLIAFITCRNSVNCVVNELQMGRHLPDFKQDFIKAKNIVGITSSGPILSLPDTYSLMSLRLHFL